LSEVVPEMDANLVFFRGEAVRFEGGAVKRERRKKREGRGSGEERKKEEAGGKGER